MPTDAYRVEIAIKESVDAIKIVLDAQRLPSFLHAGKQKTVVRVLFTDEADATMFRLKWL